MHLLSQYFKTFEPHTLISATECTKLCFTTYPSVCARFHAPSDPSGLHEMMKERVRAVASWRNGPARYDTVFVKEQEGADSISNGLTIARTRFFFSFTLNEQRHECALIENYSYVGSSVDEDSGMWIVRPTFRGRFKESRIIPISNIFRAAHLLPVYETGYKVPRSMKPEITLDSFKDFYVNKFIDHHAFEIAR